jgi:lipoprotein-anchoring transpeptidase ErfK/SrfK
MHRETRRFLLGLSTFAFCAVVGFWGIKWLFSSASTELAGKTPSREVETNGEPGLRAIVQPVTATPAKSAAEPAKPAAAKSEIPIPNKPEAKPASASQDRRLMPPTTQPTTLAKMPPTEAQKAREAGLAAREKKELIVARTHLNKALHGGLPAHDEQRVREALAQLADQTIFSKMVAKDDPLVQQYVVKAGDSLGRIARRNKVSEDFLASVNSISNKKVVRLGTSMKIVDGPFNVAVDKKDHVLHLYLQDLYLKSFKVALGMNGNTPTGVWKVINHLENPDWVDPDGKRWHANDPQNPLGEFWIGLEGIEGDAVGRTGFGIHGTIEPQTIGQDVSLGCVRMGADDIALVYKLLLPGTSIVTITE